MEFVRRLIGPLGACSRGNHKVDRQRVRHVKGDLHATCKRCGQPLVRYGPEDWRPVDQN